jgi:hypothetical protein
VLFLRVRCGALRAANVIWLTHVTRIVRESVNGNYVARARGARLAQERFCFVAVLSVAGRHKASGATPMHGLIYLIGLIVVILAILSFFGLR